MVDKDTGAFVSCLFDGLSGIGGIKTITDFDVVYTAEGLLVEATFVEFCQTKPFVAFFALEVFDQGPEEPVN